MKFNFIRAQTRLCRFLGVPPSSFYAWCKRPPSKRAIEDQALTLQIKSVFDEHHARYGSPRITRELRASGVRVGGHRVRRLMRLSSLKVRRRRRWIRTTDSNHGDAIAPNRLNRVFTADAPNRVWVSDITYLPTRQGWLYLAVVIDVFSRAVVGWSMSRNIDQILTLDALNAALERRRPGRGLVVHSDRGTQYAADASSLDYVSPLMYERSRNAA